MNLVSFTISCPNLLTGHIIPVVKTVKYGPKSIQIGPVDVVPNNLVEYFAYIDDPSLNLYFFEHLTEVNKRHSPDIWNFIFIPNCIKNF